MQERDLRKEEVKM